MVHLWIVFLVKIWSIGMNTKKESYEGDENSQEGTKLALDKEQNREEEIESNNEESIAG